MINVFVLFYALWTHRTMFYPMLCEPRFILWRANTHIVFLRSVWLLLKKINYYLFWLTTTLSLTRTLTLTMTLCDNLFRIIVSWILHNIWSLYSSYLTSFLQFRSRGRTLAANCRRNLAVPLLLGLIKTGCIWKALVETVRFLILKLNFLFFQWLIYFL